MHISFVVNPVFNGWEPTDIRLGGSEESVVCWAEELVRRGHKVMVYRNPRFINTPTAHVNGVTYKNRELYVPSHGADMCINVKSFDIPPTGPTLYLTNETNASVHDLHQYDGVIWPSKWAVDNIHTNAKRTFILPHGYDAKRIYPGQKIKKQCFYASSPDRGLETLLRIWPHVHAVHPDAVLYVTYGALLYAMPGVVNLGEVTENHMDEIYRTSEFWLHPCNGGELYCMTGIKAQAAGCIPVIIPRMALGETVKYGFKARGESDYAETLLKALSAPQEKLDSIRRRLSVATFPTWEKSVDTLEKIINSVVT